MNKKYQVFISSTFVDLVQERQSAIRAVLDLGHIPSGMEIFPAADIEQFEYIKKVIDECDYYVLIIGARYGSVDEAGLSFTEKEYDYAFGQKKTVLAFIHGDPGLIAVSKVDTDPALAAKLDAFRKKASTGRLVSFWKGTDELELKVTKALAKATTDMPGIGWIRGDAAASEDLLAQVNNLHNEVAKLRFEKMELLEQTKPRLDGIASLHEMFNVRFRIRRWTNDAYKSSDASIMLAWAEIFAAIGPKFFRPASPGLIGVELMRYLNENKGVDKHQGLELFVSDENQIKIHLTALGLIEISVAPEAAGGGVSEFASLTPNGQRQLLELLAVRGTSPAVAE
jgi:Domain of unknown function (DUF4062)